MMFDSQNKQIIQTSFYSSDSIVHFGLPPIKKMQV